MNLGRRMPFILSAVLGCNALLYRVNTFILIAFFSLFAKSTLQNSGFSECKTKKW